MLALIFARAKSGKTLDAALSFPKARFLAYEPAGLYSARTMYGLELAITHTPTFQSVTAALVAGIDERVIVVDDLTLMARATEAKIALSYKGLPIFNKFRDVAVEMLEAARATGKIVILNGHEKEARTNHAGKYIRGGIDLPMALTEAFTALVDFAGRGTKLDPDIHKFTQVHEHKAVYWLPNGSSDWAVGSRLGMPEIVPMNLGEILRASGLYAAERTIPWQEKVVSQLAAVLQKSDKPMVDELRAAYTNLLGKGIPEPQILWTLRDAEDREMIRRLRSNFGAAYRAPVEGV